MEASRLDGRRTRLEALNLLQRYTVVVDRSNVATRSTTRLGGPVKIAEIDGGELDIGQSPRQGCRAGLRACGRFRAPRQRTDASCEACGEPRHQRYNVRLKRREHRAAAAFRHDFMALRAGGSTFTTPALTIAPSHSRTYRSFNPAA